MLALRISRRCDNVHLLYALIHDYDKLVAVFPVANNTSIGEGANAQSLSEETPDGSLETLTNSCAKLLGMTSYYLDKLKLEMNHLSPLLMQSRVSDPLWKWNAKQIQMQKKEKEV